MKLTRTQREYRRNLIKSAKLQHSQYKKNQPDAYMEQRSEFMKRLFRFGSPKFNVKFSILK